MPALSVSTIVTQLTNVPINCAAWNKDKTKVAVCPNNEEIHIYEKSQQDGNATFTLAHVLKEHDKLVTGVDWAPETDRIVTCSQDRNAYVWSYSASERLWKPTLVLLRINRAATCVKWSPKENKFAVGSGARLVSVCYFEAENDWWVSKHIKEPIRSTILTIAWHPNNFLLTIGCSDNTTRVFTAAIKGIDDKPSANEWMQLNNENEKIGNFGSLCVECSSSNGWVHSVSFSPSGSAVAWVSHDGRLNVFYSTSSKTFNCASGFLPSTVLLWLSENAIVAAGHEYSPILFKGNENIGWSLVGKVDEGNLKNASFASGNASSAARNMFKQMDSRGQTSNSDVELPTCHQNTIKSISEIEVSKTNGTITKFATTSLDGKIVIWSLSTADLSSLKI